MLANSVFQRFLDEAPICVMVRATLEKVFAPERLDALFHQTAVQQYERELLFSTAFEIMSLVVCRIDRSVNAAYEKRRDAVGVSVHALYDKLKHIEPNTSRELVRSTARDIQELVHSLHPNRRPLLPGHRLKILDGNHLEGTQHRLKSLRTKGGGALPGQCLVILDADDRLLLDVFPCEDAYTQECRLAPALLETIEADDVLLDDRQFCTSELLFGLHRRSAFFITRQHAGHLRWELLGHRQSCGETESGEVFEQAVSLTDRETGETLTIRRITLQLDRPTRSRDKELHILTNLPQPVADACRIAELYRDRWRIETAFQELSTHLRCELQTLGYPPAALFGFCTAAACYNLFAVIQAALEGAHGEEIVRDDVSRYFLAEELSSTYRGMMIALRTEEWTGFGRMSLIELAACLRQWAGAVDLSRYPKHLRGPKKRYQRPPARAQHFSTARLLAATKTPKKRPPR
jgi:IS4 transposase